MAMTSKVVYSKGLRTEATHIQSGIQIITDAPIDNNGKGEAFSPTDLLATSLASCFLTIMGIRAEKMNINIDGAKAEVEKIMSSDPRRVTEVLIRVEMPKIEISEKDKKVLEAAARSCPVAYSLHPDINQKIDFYW